MTDSLLSPSNIINNKSTSSVQVKEEKLSTIKQTPALATGLPPSAQTLVVAGLVPSSVISDPAVVSEPIGLSPCSLKVDVTILPNSTPNVSIAPDSISSVKVVNTASSTNNSNVFGTSTLSAPTSSTIHSHSIHQTTYSPASVLLLSTNGLLPTPGIIGPGLDGSENGLTNMLRSPDFIGAYDPESRRQRIERFIDKRNRRVWTKKVKYDVRKNFADSRLRVKASSLFLRLFI